ncbi:unannotated protein [freshwater metagenome]|uniref:Unannotated protein n=1 Tax=freshwater metagenome TaxID=449393 RepID=A0A6J7AXK2_9ZZZZ
MSSVGRGGNDATRGLSGRCRPAEGDSDSADRSAWSTSLERRTVASRDAAPPRDPTALPRRARGRPMSSVPCGNGCSRTVLVPRRASAPQLRGASSEGRGVPAGGRRAVPPLLAGAPPRDGRGPRGDSPSRDRLGGPDGRGPRGDSPSRDRLGGPDGRGPRGDSPSRDRLGGPEGRGPRGDSPSRDRLGGPDREGPSCPTRGPVRRSPPTESGRDGPAPRSGNARPYRSTRDGTGPEPRTTGAPARRTGPLGPDSGRRAPEGARAGGRAPLADGRPGALGEVGRARRPSDEPLRSRDGDRSLGASPRRGAGARSSSARDRDCGAGAPRPGVAARPGRASGLELLPAPGLRAADVRTPALRGAGLDEAAPPDCLRAAPPEDSPLDAGAPLDGRDEVGGRFCIR